MSNLVWIDCGISQSQTPERIIERLQPILEDRDIGFLRNPRNMPNEYLTIRWGSARFSELDEQAEAILNKASSIEFNINKFLAHKQMAESGISVPIFWTTFNQAKRGSRELSCDFLRRKKHHTQGRDIIRVRSTDVLPRAKRSGYYVQLLNKDAEYRLHIFHDKCIGLAKKEQRENANPLIWNFEHGWDLTYIPQDEREDVVPHYNEMRDEAIKAVKGLNLDFGAVDLIMVGSKPYILEVNTSPKLNNTKRYSKNFIRWVGDELGIRMREE